MSAELLAVIDRDHPSDVARLNAALRLSGEARLAEHVPPHTFVGDIEGVKPGDCVLLMGINPKLNFDEDFRRVNIELPSRCLSEFRRTGDRSALDDWMAFQMGYFLREERNKRHFNKIGKWLGPRWFPGTWAEFEEKEAIQMVLHRHLVEVDAVQYFSHEPAREADPDRSRSGRQHEDDRVADRQDPAKVDTSQWQVELGDDGVPLWRREDETAQLR